MKYYLSLIVDYFSFASHPKKPIFFFQDIFYFFNWMLNITCQLHNSFDA